MVEREQGAPAGMAERDDAVKAVLTQEHLPGRGIEQRLLMDQGEVVVDRSGALGPHRVPAGEQLGHQDVVGQILAGVHQRDHRARGGHHPQHPGHRGPVRGGQLVHRCHRGFGRLRGVDVAAGAEPPSVAAHRGATRSLSLSHWVIRDFSNAATLLYQTAWRHPVARRSMMISESQTMRKYGPTWSMVTAGSWPATAAIGVFSGTSRTNRVVIGSPSPWIPAAVARPRSVR